VGAHENLPIDCVNWWEAYAFCIFDGGFLPTEAEWEYAAAAGSQQREYPWGTAAPGTTNQYEIFGCNYPNGDGMCLALTGSVAPVGTAALGASLYGQQDLLGNVSEWVLDWYATSYVNPCLDCADVTPGAVRVNRGGYFSGSSPDLTGRGYLTPTWRLAYGLGFRCARPSVP
jgi:formylglycine-generating enzyme required for sulfatase activity